MKKEKRKYALMGFIILVILAASYWGFNYLKGNDLFNNQHKYYVMYESIEGLSVSNAVTMNGYEIGQVSEIKMIQDQGGKLLIEITTEEEYQIPDSSVAMIYSMDLMGTKGIKIVRSGINRMYNDGDTLPGSSEKTLQEQVSMQMLPVKNQAEELMKEIQTVIEVIGYIFNEQTQANLQKSFTSIKKTVDNLESSSQNLDSMLIEEKGRISSIVSKIDQITTTLNDNKEYFSNTMKNFSEISDSLKAVNIKKTLDDVDKVMTDLAVITEKINSGEGSMGKLVNNDSLYRELEKASTNLDKLIWDIRANPDRYLNVRIFDIGRKVQVIDESTLNKREKKKLKKKRERMEE